MRIFPHLAAKLYAHVVSYLPWSYIDASHSSSIDVLKITTGLRIVTTQIGSQYKEIIVDVPQEVIKSLMDR